MRGPEGALALVGLLVFVAGIWALLNILHSPAAPPEKALWVALILIPVLGVVLWHLLGPRRAASSASR